jgi:hypothetical protein
MTQAFRGLIAVILLGLYVYTVYDAIVVARCVGTSGCAQFTADSFTSGFSHTMSSVGGLVSALVIAALAGTKPGESPTTRVVGGALEALPKLSSAVAGLYLLVWVITGAAAYVFGAMLYPTELQPLTDLGQSWLGLAVAAAYSYFGISPEGGGAAGGGAAAGSRA